MFKFFKKVLEKIVIGTLVIISTIILPSIMNWAQTLKIDAVYRNDVN